MEGKRSSTRVCLLAVAMVLVVSELMSNCKVEAGSNSWWSLGLYGCDLQQLGRKQCRNCAAMHFYNLTTAEQAQQCSEDSSAVRSISKGARHAILDCQRRFNASRWNCSTFQSQYIFGEFIEWVTKETALLHSYFTAGALWALATDCQSEKIVNCVCIREGKDREQDAEGNLLFYTCNANVDFARHYLDTFVLNNLQNNGSIPALVNWQNSIVGINNEKIQERTCRCHGISGTCSAQTCHLKLKSVEEVGEKLVELYEETEKVNMTAVTATTDENNFKTLKHLEDSPNFCNRSDAIGVLGVQGRLCELNHPKHSCSSLCCNRGFSVTTEVVPIEDCKFVWCCHVRCIITGEKVVPKFHCN